MLCVANRGLCLRTDKPSLKPTRRQPPMIDVLNNSYRVPHAALHLTGLHTGTFNAVSRSSEWW